MTRRTLIILAIVGVTACTPTELDRWLDWHHHDPAAAIDYANQPHIQLVELHADATTDPPPATGVASAPTVWDNLAWCESGEDWTYNGGSGFDGGLQFLPAVWTAYGGPTDYAWQASREQQIAVAERILADQGWGAWPACARRLGLR